MTVAKNNVYSVFVFGEALSLTDPVTHNDSYSRQKKNPMFAVLSCDIIVIPARYNNCRPNPHCYRD